MMEFEESKQERKYKQLREEEEEGAMKALSGDLGIPYVDLTSVSISPDALVLVPEAVAREASLAVFGKTEKALDIALHSPTKPEVQKVLEDLAAKGFTSSLFVASTKSLAFAWDRYKDFGYATESKHGMLDISSEDIEKFVAEVHDVETVK